MKHTHGSDLARRPLCCGVQQITGGGPGCQEPSFQGQVEENNPPPQKLENEQLKG